MSVLLPVVGFAIRAFYHHALAIIVFAIAVVQLVHMAHGIDECMALLSAIESLGNETAVNATAGVIGDMSRACGVKMLYHSLARGMLAMRGAFNVLNELIPLVFKLF
ncbi:MAG: hypothetical protein WC732_09760 [Candidatus Omnitrophota bacterium]